MADTDRFAGALDATRRERGLTMEDLGALVGVSGAAASNWVRGVNRPDPDRLFALERALGCSPGELSRLLGYLPLEAKDVTSPEDAVRSDHTLSGNQRDALLDVLAAYRAVNRTQRRKG